MKLRLFVSLFLLVGSLSAATHTVNSANSLTTLLNGGTIASTTRGASNGQFIDFPTASITATYHNQASGDGTNRTMTFTVNGGSAVTVTFPGNGNWSSFQTTTATVTFANSAANSVVLASGNAPDLDYFEYVQ